MYIIDLQFAAPYSSSWKELWSEQNRQLTFNIIATLLNCWSWFLLVLTNQKEFDLLSCYFTADCRYIFKATRSFYFTTRRLRRRRTKLQLENWCWADSEFAIIMAIHGMQATTVSHSAARIIVLFLWKGCFVIWLWFRLKKSVGNFSNYTIYKK